MNRTDVRRELVGLLNDLDTNVTAEMAADAIGELAERVSNLGFDADRNQEEKDLLEEIQAARKAVSDLNDKALVAAAEARRLTDLRANAIALHNQADLLAKQARQRFKNLTIKRRDQKISIQTEGGTR